MGRPFPLEAADEHFARLRLWGFTFLRFLVTWEAVEHEGPGKHDEEYLAYLVAVVRKAREHGISLFSMWSPRTRTAPAAPAPPAAPTCCHHRDCRDRTQPCLAHPRSPHWLAHPRSPLVLLRDRRWRRPAVDPHMDCWSRFTGGDGAPGWTLEAIGFELRHLHPTGAAFVHSHLEGAPMPAMTWPTNMLKLASATMYTLFLAGDDFAPECRIEGETAQRFLVRHYLGAMGAIAHALRDEPNVVGFDSLNEPSNGFVGRADLTSSEGLKNGLFTTGWQTIALGAGVSLEARRYSPPFVPRGMVSLNPRRLRAWAEGRTCVWQQHGVWAPDAATGAPRLLKPDYFRTRPADGAEVHVDADYLLPLWEALAAVLRQVERPAGVAPYILFGELHVDLNDTDQTHTHTQFRTALARLPRARLDALLGQGTTCLAPHWYDGLPLLFKAFRTWWTVDLISCRPVWGAAASLEACARFLRGILAQGAQLTEHGHTAPMLVGETGVPFDMGMQLHPTVMWLGESINLLLSSLAMAVDLMGLGGLVGGGHGGHGGGAPAADELGAPLQALERTMGVLEANLASFTLWNYTPEHTRAQGDGWNGEDLSVYSEEARTHPSDLHSGGRALPALVRPHARKVAGTARFMRFDSADAERTFVFAFTHAEGIAQPTEIFVPFYQYPHGAVEVSVSDGTYTLDTALQTLFYAHSAERSEHTIVLTRKRPSSLQTLQKATRGLTAIARTARAAVTSKIEREAEVEAGQRRQA